MQAKKLNRTEIIKLAKLGHELQLENILLKDALQEAHARITKLETVTNTANNDFIVNCLFYKSPLTNGKCPHIYKGCQMQRTCEAVMKLGMV